MSNTALEPDLTTAIVSYMTYLVWIMMAYLNDFVVRYIFGYRPYNEQMGYAPLFDDFNAFYTRYFYGRISDCWNRPICSTPGPWIDVMERTGNDLSENLKLNGQTKKCLNLGSYNYLGFAENSTVCTQQVSECLKKYSTSTCSPRAVLGSLAVHAELEDLVARFLGKESAMVFGMGYATNSTGLPPIAGKGCLIISDALNHASLVVGMRSSGAKVDVFKHNDMNHLERVLRKAIVHGQPRTRQPWKLILVVVEGIYSMEGEICDLPRIIALKKKYKAYLYIDEAHSIGALGKRGRGVCDYWGVNPADVDILMGTFTKSFGSTGGYIAGSKDFIDYLRVASYSHSHDTSISAPAAQQIISSMRIISGEDNTGEGEKRLTALRKNSNFFRKRLREIGFKVFGSEDSPVIPVMIYSLSKMPAFSRKCLENNIAVVVAGYPATPLLLCRVRFCISAAHNEKDLEEALRKMEQVGHDCLMIYETPQLAH